MSETTSRLFLKRRDAAARLDVSTRTIDRLRAAGDLDWIRVGRVVRIDLRSMEGYERRRRLTLAQALPEGGESLGRLPIPALDEDCRKA